MTKIFTYSLSPRLCPAAVAWAGLRGHRRGEILQMPSSVDESLCWPSLLLSLITKSRKYVSLRSSWRKGRTLALLGAGGGTHPDSVAQGGLCMYQQTEAANEQHTYFYTSSYNTVVASTGSSYIQLGSLHVTLLRLNI